MIGVGVVLCSSNATWLSNFKTQFQKNKIRYITVRGLPRAYDYEEPAIYIIDVDTQRNKEMLEKIKEKENLISLYLSSVNISNAALEFPKYEIVGNVISDVILQRIIESGQKIYDSYKEQEDLKEVLPKEEAIKNVTSSIVLEKVESEKNDDDFFPEKKDKKEITNVEAIYEEEDDFDDFDDRPDLKKLSLKKKDEIEKQNLEKTEKDISEVKTEEKKTIYDKLYSMNERKDRDLTDSEYVDKLDLENELRAPIIHGLPLVYINPSKRIAIDDTLSIYRIQKLKEEGLQKMQIVKILSDMKKEEDKIRKVGLEKREETRLNLIKGEDISARKERAKRFEDILDISVKKEEKEEKKKAPISSSPKIGPKIESKDRAEKFIKESGIKIEKRGAIEIDKNHFDEGTNAATAVRIEYDKESVFNRPQKEKLESDEIAKRIQESTNNRKLSIEDTENLSNDLNRLFKENRERLAREAEERLNNSQDSLLPGLPTSRLTDRNPMSRYTQGENINVQRAESRTNIKSMRPPIEMVTEIEPDEIKKKKKKGFFGFKKD